MKGLVGTVRKADLTRFIKGHVRAGEITSQERAQRLASLTVEQARKEYDELCATWRSHPERTSLGEADSLRLEHLLVRRRRLDRLGPQRPGR